MGAYKRSGYAGYLRATKRRRGVAKGPPLKRRKGKRAMRRRSAMRAQARRYGRALVSQVFPTRRMMTHSWTYYYTANVATGNFQNPFGGAYVKVNNLYDPYSGITGWGNVVPSLYTLMAGQYNRYTVLGAKVIMVIRPHTLFNVAATNTILSGNGGGSVYAGVNNPPMRFGLVLDDNATLSETSYDKLVGAKFHTYRDMTPNITGDRPNYVTLKSYFSAKKFFGEGKMDDTYGAAVGSAPTKQAYVIPYAQVLDQTSAPVCNVFGIHWKVSFKVLWSNPKDYVNYQGS